MLFRAFYALPDTITGDDGQPVNALLGTANLVLREVDEHSPRAVVLCFGPDAADYRVELYDGYHAERPEVPDTLAPQFADCARLLRGLRVDRRGQRDARGRRPARLLRRGRVGGRREHARDDRRPRHVPVRHRPRDRPLREHRRPRRRGGGPGRGERSATGCPRSWCRTSSRCAAIPPTAFPAPRASARRRRPSCSARHGSLEAALDNAMRETRPEGARRAPGPARRAAALQGDRDAPATRASDAHGSRHQPRRRRQGGHGQRGMDRLAGRLEG